MGKLYYGLSTEAIEMPDRILAHLKVLVTTKLRRSESFALSWDQLIGDRVQRTSIWLQPSIPLRFEVDAESSRCLDRNYLQDLAQAAQSSAGIIIELADLVAEQPQIAPVTELERAA